VLELVELTVSIVVALYVRIDWGKVVNALAIVKESSPNGNGDSVEHSLNLYNLKLCWDIVVIYVY